MTALLDVAGLAKHFPVRRGAFVHHGLVEIRLEPTGVARGRVLDEIGRAHV